MAEEEGKAIEWPGGADEAIDFDFLMVGKDGEPIMKIPKEKLNEVIVINGEGVKAVAGGATSATPTILRPGPAGANRKMEDVEGWFVNGTAAEPPVAIGTPWEAPTGMKNTNWWDGTTWSLGSSVELPVDPNGVKKSDINTDTIESINKANPARIINDRFISTTANNGIQVSTGWAIIIIPFPENTQFTISRWLSSRSEIGFWKGAVPAVGANVNNANVITSGSAASQGLSKTDGVMTGVTPALTTSIVITIENNTEAPSVHAELMAQIGDVASPSYIPYGDTVIVKGLEDNSIAPDKVLIGGNIVSTDNLLLKGSEPDPVEFTYNNSLSGVFSTLTFQYKGKSVMQRFETKNPLALGTSKSFDWSQMTLDGVLKHSMADENAPYRITGYTVGGNHGFRRFNITENGHNKTTVDIGSVWTDGTNQWVIVGIPDANTIAVSHRTDNTTALTANTLTHVSGATNTSNINSTTKVSTDAYPSYKNYSLKTYVDGIEVTTNDIFTGKGKLTFIETYDILLKSSIIDWFVANVGSISVPTQPDGTAIARITNSFSFDTKMMCNTQQSFEALYDVDLPFQDIMFLMNNRLSVPYNVYVPKSIPFTQSGDNYDFRVPMAYTTPTSYRIDFSPERYSKWGRTPDRAMHIATDENLGFCIGFLPVEDATTERRKVLASRKTIQFQESGKIYMSAVDSFDIITFKKGDIYSIQGYKGYFFREGKRTANYVVDSPQGKFHYFDWHQNGIDEVQLPDTFEIVERSPNVMIIDSSKVSIKIDSENVYGFLIIKE